MPLQTLTRFFSGSFWLILAAVLSQGSMLASNFLVANLVGVHSYGRYALLQTTIQLLAGLAQISLTVIIAQQVARARQQEPKLAGEITTFSFMVVFALSTIFALGLFWGRTIIADQLFRDPGLGFGLGIAALAVPWVAAAAVQQGLFSGLERFREQAWIALALVPIVVAIPALGALRGGFAGAVIGVTLAYFLRFAFPQLVVMRLFRQAGLTWTLGAVRSKVSVIFQYALPATLSGILNSLAIWGGQTLLVRSDGGAATVGLFAAAYMIKTMAMFVPSQMVIALLPMLSRFYADPAAGDPRRLLIASTAVSAGFTAVLAGAGILAASFIMGLFGHDFTVGRPVLIILLAATPLEAITSNLTLRFQATSQFWRALLCTNLPLAVTLLGGAAVLVPRWQGTGLAIAWLMGWAFALGGALVGSRTWKRSRAGGASPA
jgi:O-antigen/teichoic acid export membrane protein